MGSKAYRGNCRKEKRSDDKSGRKDYNNFPTMKNKD